MHYDINICRIIVPSDRAIKQVKRIQIAMELVTFAITVPTTRIPIKRITMETGLAMLVMTILIMMVSHLLHSPIYCLLYYFIFTGQQFHFDIRSYHNTFLYFLKNWKNKLGTKSEIATNWRQNIITGPLKLL